MGVELVNCFLGPVIKIECDKYAGIVFNLPASGGSGFSKIFYFRKKKEKKKMGHTH